MLSTKGVILLLLVCTVISPRSAFGKNPICTHGNMLEIVRKCEKFIRLQHPVPMFLCSPNSPCCEAVRKVRNRDMRCVYFLIELDKKVKLYSEHHILRLGDVCAPVSPPPPHHQVMV
uniref:Bifunctional inhibitor/plant lipid transfer protein/seed storage helical domain-containing protein n=1 Tax=Oryza glumipatula TaxID=40148 RepID=A0A0D9ZWD9_9ORYZ